jgi:xanthine dehydrogenase molybdopterin-binding subunit B
MLHGVTVRSPKPRGRIRRISFKGNLPWDEFVVVTAKDIPGANHVALILDDQPYLADGVVNHAEEPVVLLAHKDKYLLEEARRNVEIEITNFRQFLRSRIHSAEEIIWETTTSFKKFLVNKGNVDEVWTNADLIIEGYYETARRNNCTSKTMARLRSRIRPKVLRSGDRCSVLTTFTKAGEVV